MKRNILMVLLALLFCGCQSVEKTVTVNISGGGAFPESLAGKWVAETDFWQISFDSDGSILSANIGLGGIEVFPGKATKFTTHKGGEAYYEPGLWTVDFDPETRILRVEIVISSFYHEVLDDALTGDSQDILVGKVSDDWSRWDVKWYNAGLMVAIVGEPKELDNIEEPELRKSIVFNKTVKK